MTIWTEQDSIDLTAHLIADDGYRMPVRRDERRAAVRLMVERGRTTEEIADRVCMSLDALSVFCSRERISLKREDPHAWMRRLLDQRASHHEPRRHRGADA